jgi:2-beta-glucuronyltransferase
MSISDEPRAECPMNRVVLVSNHCLESPVKAGFAHLAESFWRAGWDVLFFTESISWLTLLRGRDRRSDQSIFRQANRLRLLRDRLASYVWLTPFHPINLRSSLLNRLSTPVLELYPRFSLGAAAPAIARADLFVFDSDHGLFLFDRFKKINPHARFAYRVSDDIRILGHHPSLPAQEERILPRFDLVSAAFSLFCQRHAGLSNVRFHNHGLEKSLFDRLYANPYPSAGPNVIYVGMSFFDADFMVRAARLFPDWQFHVFGAVGRLPAAANLISYGKRPFAELIPYLRHADIGLQNLRYTPGAECFTDSLKMIQYTYCKLPIVAPSFLRQDRQHVFYYAPGNDASIRQAMLAARACDRSRITTASILSWDDLGAILAENNSEPLRLSA